MINTGQTAASNIIEARDLTRSFSSDTGVFDVSFALPQGAILGLIGPSGSGKTTTVRLMTGLLSPERGSVRVLGQEAITFTTRTRERIGYMPQDFVLYPNLTVSENLNFVASLYGMGYLKRREHLTRVLELVELQDARRRLGHQLSGGMQRRLALACALVHNPVLLFADEPTAGIDPVLRGVFWQYFRELREQGHTLVITTQYVGEAAYCDLVGVMRNGRLLHLNTPDELRRIALGGEVIKLVLPPTQVIDAMQILQRFPAVNDVRRSRNEPGLLYVYTEQASTTLPQLFTLFEQHPDITIEQAQEYQPPFDDLFIRLMEREDAQGAHA